LVATQYDNNRNTDRFPVRPDCSLSWRNSLRFYAGMVVVTFGIAIAFAVQGACLGEPEKAYLARELGQVIRLEH